LNPWASPAGGVSMGKGEKKSTPTGEKKKVIKRKRSVPI